MPAPGCTCEIEIDTRYQKARLLRCPRCEAAGDLYEAVERYFNLPADPSDMQISEADQQARAALLKANPQRTTQEQDARE